jgi:hemoglobin/transferrin/lactoferrin receptor protein
MDSQGRAMLGLRPWEPLTLTFEAMQSVGYDIGIPGGVSSMPALARVTYPRSKFTFLSLDATLDVNSAYLKTLEGSVYYTANERRVLVDKIPPAASGAYPVELKPSADHETWGGKLQGTVEAGNHTIVAGSDFWTWSVSTKRKRSMWRPAPAGGPITFSDSTVPDATQVSTGLYVEDNWKLHEDWTLNLGARLDYLHTRAASMYLVSPAPGPNNTTRTRLYGDTDESDIGWHAHAGLTWKISQAWSQSVLLASSYRAADVMERFKYVSLGGGIELYGNPKLDPEQSFYAEYGLHYDQKPFRADLRLFANALTNYIAEKNVSPTRIELDNVSEARIYGVEFDARWQFLDNWGLYGNVTALHGRDERKKRALPGVAPVSGKVGVDFTHPAGFWAKIEGVGIAPQYYRPAGVEQTDGVITVNAAAGYRFQTASLKHDISLSLNNIFDARYYNYLAQQRGYRVWEPGFAAMLNYSIEF